MANKQNSSNGEVNAATEGFTRIPNKLLDKLAFTRIRGEARQVLDFIIRKTLGFNKLWDRIAHSQFVTGTGLYKSQVYRSLKFLTESKIVLKKKNRNSVDYAVNLLYDEWGLGTNASPPTKPSPPTKVGTKPLQTGDESVGHNIHSSKENKINSQNRIPFEEIIEHLNKVTGKSYKADNGEIRALINSRWSEGYRIDDFVHVNRVKALKWIGTEWEEFLRPSTLYGKKFDQYRQESIPRDKLLKRSGQALAGENYLKQKGIPLPVTRSEQEQGWNRAMNAYAYQCRLAGKAITIAGYVNAAKAAGADDKFIQTFKDQFN